MADIKVLSTHAMEGVLRELSPAFERAGGFRAIVAFDPANAIRRRIESGISFDVAIVTRPVIDALAARAIVLGESCVDLARSGLGVVVRSGVSKPDIASAAAFKKTLLAARSVVRSKEGTSGIYFDALLHRLGIAEVMRERIVLGGSGRIAEFVARGEAELAVQQIPELLPVNGVQLVGPLPAELQLYTVFSAGIGASSQNQSAARDLIAHIARPEAAGAYIAKGLEPIAC